MGDVGIEEADLSALMVHAQFYKSTIYSSVQEI